jgi:hypothetical protein
VARRFGVHVDDHEQLGAELQDRQAHQQAQKAEACQLKSVDVIVVPHSGLDQYRVDLLRAGRHPARFQQEQRAVSV